MCRHAVRIRQPRGRGSSSSRSTSSKRSRNSSTGGSMHGSKRRSRSSALLGSRQGGGSRCSGELGPRMGRRMWALSGGVAGQQDQLRQRGRWCKPADRLRCNNGPS